MASNQEYLQEIIDQGADCVYAQLLKNKDSMSPETWKKTLCAFAPHSFLCFVEAMCGPRFTIRDFHKVIASVLQHLAYGSPETYKRLILAAPPRSGKSTLVQLFTAWLVGLNPRTAQMFASYGQRLSTKFMNKIHALVQQPEFLLCFPDFTGFTQGSKTELCSGGSFLATSVGGASTGFDGGSLDLVEEIMARRALQPRNEVPWGTPGLLTVDDPLKAGSSEAELEALDGWWTDEFNTRRTGNWIQLLIATRFSLRDLHGKLLAWDGLYDSVKNPKGWLYLNITALREPLEVWDPVGRAAVDQPLWPGHSTLNLEECLNLRRINPQRFTCLYQGNPVLEEGGNVPAEIIRPSETPPEEFVWVVTGIDCSEGLSEEADETGIVTVGLCPMGQLWVLRADGKVLDFVQLRESITDLSVELEPDCVAIELASNGVALYTEMLHDPDRFEFAGEVEGYKPKTYGSKAKRLGSVMDMLKVLRWSNIFDKSGLEKELLTFPFGLSDNLLDALVWALIAIRPSWETFEPEPDSNEKSPGNTVASYKDMGFY